MYRSFTIYIIFHNENSICGSKNKIRDNIRHTIIDVLSLEDSRKNKIQLSKYKHEKHTARYIL